MKPRAHNHMVKLMSKTTCTFDEGKLIACDQLKAELKPFELGKKQDGFLLQTIANRWPPVEQPYEQVLRDACFVNECPFCGSDLIPHAAKPEQVAEAFKKVKMKMMLTNLSNTVDHLGSARNELKELSERLSAPHGGPHKNCVTDLIAQINTLISKVEASRPALGEIPSTAVRAEETQ